MRSSKRSSRAILRPIVAWRERPTGGGPVPLRSSPADLAQRFAAAPGSGERWIPTARSSPRWPSDLDGSFEALVLAHQDRLYSIALRLLGDPRDAEEAAQDAFVRAYRALVRLRPGTDPRAPAPAVAGHDRAQPVPLAADPAAGRRPAGPCRSTARCRATSSRATDEAHGPAATSAARAAAGRLGRPAADPAAGLSQRRRAAPRRRPVLPGARHRPRSTRGHRQGAGPPRPGPVAHGVRGRPAARTRGDDRMTTDDRDLEAAMAGLSTHAPADARAERPRRGRAGRPLCPVRLPDRAARGGLERPGRVDRGGGRRRRRVRGGPSRPDRPARPSAPTACPIGWPRPSPAGSAAIAGSGSTSTCAATPTSSATSGTRRSRSRAARSGRTAGSPPRSAGRRRSARSGPRSATTRCRSSCRATASSGRTARSASTRWAGPRTSGRSSTAEGLDLESMEQLASSGVRFIGSDTTKIFCLPTCRHARRVTDRHRLEFHSMAEGQARGYRACLVCRPASAYAA